MEMKMPLSRYDPPGFMADFDALPGARDQWSAAVSGWFTEIIAAEQSGPLNGQPCQYHNAHTDDVTGPAFDKQWCGTHCPERCATSMDGDKRWS